MKSVTVGDRRSISGVMVVMFMANGNRRRDVVYQEACEHDGEYNASEVVVAKALMAT